MKGYSTFPKPPGLLEPLIPSVFLSILLSTIGVTVTFMLHSFFSSLARSKYFSSSLPSFSFTLWSAGTAKSTRWQVLFFLSIKTRSSLFLLYYSIIEQTMPHLSFKTDLLSAKSSKNKKIVCLIKKNELHKTLSKKIKKKNINTVVLIFYMMLLWIILR